MLVISRFFLRAFLALAVAGLTVAGHPYARAGAAGPTIRIGVVADLTGQGAAYGISVANGAKLAGQMLNKHGGVGGHSVEIVVDDPGSVNSQVINVFQQDATTKNVLAIVGPTLSSEAKVADPVAQQLGVPVVATSNTAPGIPQIGPYIFRLGLGEAAVIPLAMKAAEKNLHFKRVAIIYGNDNAFTQADGLIFAAVAKKMGLTIVDTETFATGDRDFSTQLTKIRSARPGAILCGALKNEAVPILVQARRLGLTARFIGGNGFNTPAVITGAGQASEGAIEGTAWFANGTSPRNLIFIAAYKAAYGKLPDQLAAQAYDAINVIAAAATKVRTTSDRKALRNALVGIRNVPVITGSTGLFSFTSDRDSGETGTVQAIHNGKYEAYT